MSAENLRIDAARLVAAAVKHAARDPDSVKFDSMRVSGNARVVCSEFRAANGFGGLNREFIVVADGKTRNDVGSWNTKCTGSMFDHLASVE